MDKKFVDALVEANEKLEAAFWAVRWLHGDERVPEDMRQAWLSIMDAIEAAPDIYDTFDIYGIYENDTFDI